MVAILKRLLIIGLAFAAAGLAAIVTFLLAINASLSNPVVGDDLFPLTQIFGVFLGGYTLFFTAVPGAVLVLIGEMLRIRTWYFYVLGAGVAAAFAVFVHGFDFFLLSLTLNRGLGLGVLAAGFVGGGVYWLIAGRRA